MSCPKGPAGPIGFRPLTASEAKTRTETSRENNKRIYQDEKHRTMVNIMRKADLGESHLEIVDGLQSWRQCLPLIDWLRGLGYAVTYHDDTHTMWIDWSFPGLAKVGD